MAKAKSTKPPAFQFFARDFIASSRVQRMSLEAIGAYILLLSYAWIDDGLPSSTADLARMVKLPHRHFLKIWGGALGTCFVENKGRLVNERQEDIRKKLIAFGKKQSDRAASKWDKARHQSGTAAASVRDTRNDALQSASASASTPSEERGSSARRQPIVSPRRGDAAFEGHRVYVPQKLHRDFVALRNHPGAERELLAWYEAVAVDWHTGARKSDEPGADMFVFWRARYAETWPTTKSSTTGRTVWDDMRDRVKGAAS